MCLYFARQILTKHQKTWILVLMFPAVSQVPWEAIKKKKIISLNYPKQYNSAYKNTRFVSLHSSTNTDSEAIEDDHRTVAVGVFQMPKSSTSDAREFGKGEWWGLKVLKPEGLSLRASRFLQVVRPWGVIQWKQQWETRKISFPTPRHEWGENMAFWTSAGDDSGNSIKYRLELTWGDRIAKEEFENNSQVRKSEFLRLQ